MVDGLTRDVTTEEIEEYREIGVVNLKGILGRDWVDLLGNGLDEVFSTSQESFPVFYDSTEIAEQMKQQGVEVLDDERSRAMSHSGRFLTIIGGWTVNENIRKVALESPLSHVAGRLFGSSKVNFYDDQLLCKEPGAKEYTAFHTDEPYYHLKGEQVCGMWVSPDVVTEDASAMQYVRGSHKWPGVFKPNVFVARQTLSSLGLSEEEGEQNELPDIEGNRDDYDIVTYPSEPGDVIVHQSRLIHGSGPNYTIDSPRRAASLRYTGDDVTYYFHRSAPPQPHHQHTLKNGDAIDCDQFPVVWRAA